MEGQNKIEDLPTLPSNARYTTHENKCYDWGTFGWAMQTGKVDTSKYKYIIFMNSSVRGPYLPPYWPVSPGCHLQPCWCHQFMPFHTRRADWAVAASTAERWASPKGFSCQ